MNMDLIRALLSHYLGLIARKELQARLTKHVPDIVAGMLTKQIVHPPVPLDLVTRDALFRLLRSVIPSGDVSDLIRDQLEGKIKPRVADRVTANSSLTEIVKLTLAELMSAVFDS